MRSELLPLSGRRIVLGVTGGIAAYKSVEVCRRLVEAGAFVSPVLTRGALRFVGATTFSALASEPVRTTLFDEHAPIPHTQLGQAADLVLVCPATARSIGSYAAGISDGLLTATLLATRAPVIVCPAMHTEMWEHAAVQENLATLRRRGVVVVDPEDGRLAGGDSGSGRLAAPETIVEAVLATLRHAGDLLGTRVLVTTGGTREAIDPVRVITNRSSGKQGIAIAEEAQRRGADVTLVTTVDRPVHPSIVVVPVVTAQEMQDAVLSRAAQQDVIVMAAAVADFRPRVVADQKLKKGDGPPQIVLEATHDFLVDLGATKPPGQTLVGFAAETQDLLVGARDKLVRKNLDLIVANDVSAPGVGFEHDTNAVVILDKGGAQEHSLQSKIQIAKAVVDAVVLHRADLPAT